MRSLTHPMNVRSRSSGSAYSGQYDVWQSSTM